MTEEDYFRFSALSIMRSRIRKMATTQPQSRSYFLICKRKNLVLFAVLRLLRLSMTLTNRSVSCLAIMRHCDRRWYDSHANRNCHTDRVKC